MIDVILGVLFCTAFIGALISVSSEWFYRVEETAEPRKSETL